MWIASVDAARAMDRRATEEYGIPAKVLMERAGLAVFEAVYELLPHAGRITVLCGKGNNGGDGFVAAREAHVRHFQVDCLVAAHEHELSPLADEQMRIARAQGVEPIFLDDARWSKKLHHLGSRDLLVDALLGTGARCEVQGAVRDAIEAINRSGVPVVAVDVPSGICADSGEELGESVWALRTVTFGLPKPYLFEGTGLEHAGYWTVADIGYPPALLDEPRDARLVDGEWVGSLLPERLRASHKGDNGSVLIVAGSERMPGAAALAARAAMRAGAGLVTVAAIPSVCQTIAMQLPEVTFLPLPENHGVISADAARVVLEARGRYHAALFGPGMTHTEPALEFLTKTWSDWSMPSVIDADALNAVSHGVPLPQAPCVLTPHPGEMSRLLQSSIAEIQADRFLTVRQAVIRFGQTVLLKGPYSIVGSPESAMNVNATGNPGLASAGMGDVLGGVIATLLSQAIPPETAAVCGAYWHGAAADLCAAEIGCIGYTASEVANALPGTRATIVASCDRSPCS